MNRNYVDKLCNNLKIGECITISYFKFEEAFPYGYPSIYRTSVEAFLSSKIGAAWGCWKVTQDFFTRNYTISRHEESNQRVYCDPDREHLFKRNKEGFLIPKYEGEK